MASQLRGCQDPPSPPVAGPTPSEPSFGGTLLRRHRPGSRRQSPRHGARLTSASRLRRGRSGREGNKSK